MDTAVSNTRIARQWITAFNEHDLEKLLRLYHEDAVHFSPRLKLKKPASGGFITGKAGLREWWADAFLQLPTLQYELINLIADQKQVLMEYIRKAPADPDMMIAEILEIENGLIIRSRLYLS